MNNLSYRLIKNYEETPNKVCLCQGNKKITYKRLYEMVESFKNYLVEQGIKKGDKVLVLVPMSIELYVTLLAIWSIGAVASFMDAGFIKNGMKNNDFANINALVGINKYILYSNINKNLKKLKIKINVKIISKLQNRNNLLKVEEVEKDYPAIMTYTSGTTGKPKIAARTHEFLGIQGSILENTLNYEKKDVEISTIPIFTLSNINVGITTIIAEANFASLGKSKAKPIVSQIINNNVNRIMASPGFLGVILNYCKAKNIVLTGVKKIFTGGGAVFIDFINNLKSVFPNASIVTLYGSTEAEPIAHLDVKQIDENVLEKIRLGFGILAGEIVGVEDCVTISTDKKEIGSITVNEFNDLKTDGVGEIVVSGKNVLDGYVDGYGDKENKFSVDGKRYHRTGDLGFIDEDGKLWLRGRIKEPYFNIESALHLLYNIGKTAVFKSNDKLILVLENRDLVSEEELKNTLKFEKIDEIKYVKKIPVDRRHSTKVDYNELRKVLKI